MVCSRQHAALMDVVTLQWAQMNIAEFSCYHLITLMLVFVW